MVHGARQGAGQSGQRASEAAENREIDCRENEKCGADGRARPARSTHADWPPKQNTAVEISIRPRRTSPPLAVARQAPRPPILRVPCAAAAPRPASALARVRRCPHPAVKSSPAENVTAVPLEHSHTLPNCPEETPPRSINSSAGDDLDQRSARPPRAASGQSSRQPRRRPSPLPSTGYPRVRASSKLRVSRRRCNRKLCWLRPPSDRRRAAVAHASCIEQVGHSTTARARHHPRRASPHHCAFCRPPSA